MILATKRQAKLGLAAERLAPRTIQPAPVPIPKRLEILSAMYPLQSEEAAALRRMLATKKPCSPEERLPNLALNCSISVTGPIEPVSKPYSNPGRDTTIPMIKSRTTGGKAASVTNVREKTKSGEEMDIMGDGEAGSLIRGPAVEDRRLLVVVLVLRRGGTR